MQAHEKLKARRKALKLNQKEAAARVGVSFTTWFRWENDIQRISPPALAGSLLLLGSPAAEAVAAARDLMTAARG